MEHQPKMEHRRTDEATAYVAPTVTIHGSVAEVTRANHVGNVTDKTYPAGTPITSLTFS